MLENKGTISLGVSFVTVRRRVPEPAAGITAVFINKLLSTNVYKMISKVKPIKIVIVGAGGCGRDFLWTLLDCNKILKKYNIIGFIDDDKSLIGKKVDGIPVLGGLDWFKKKSPKEISCLVAIADSRTRFEIVKKLKSINVKFPIVIHPSVIASQLREIGEGSVIQAGCIFAPNTRLGRHVQINLDCTIGHDSFLDDFVTLTTGIHINGNNMIGRGTYVGTGAVTQEKIKIGKWSKVAAGTVLLNNVPDYSMYVGIPGRLKKKLSRDRLLP